MANYRTCHNCTVDRNECATRDRIKRAIAGLSVTSVKFKCPVRQPLYRTGDRVEVTWIVPQCEDPSYEDMLEESWPATVIKEVGPRFLICVDDVDSDNETPARSYIKSATLYANVSAEKLRPLEEPARSVCGLCGIVAGNGFEGCWQVGTVPNSRCLRVICGEGKR